MTKEKTPPSLFGLTNSNRDFSTKESWGKNKFNSSFPASLCCYMSHKNINANYLCINNKKFSHKEITIEQAFGIKPDSPDTYFAFEATHSPFQKYVIGSLPRTDLVIQNSSTGNCIAGLEVKLTALPDNTTCELDDKNYGSEIVVRPDTIVYLACSLANRLAGHLEALINPDAIAIKDWSDARQVLPHITEIITQLASIYKKAEICQIPFLLQPIWKTEGKSPKLADACLDVFFWSDAAFLSFITEIANSDSSAPRITRQTRTAIWLYKMLVDIVAYKKFNHQQIIDSLSYNTKNDKAFASSGIVTNRFMACSRLLNPIVGKHEIKKIILGGGQNLLSPERRFDAIIFNSPELF